MAPFADQQPETFETIRRNHEAISPEFAAFLDFANKSPACCRPIDRLSLSLPQGVAWEYPLQAWPTLIGPERREMVHNASRGIMEMILSLPEKVFEGDFARMASFYGIAAPALMKRLLTPPLGLDGLLARLDFLDSDRGFVCLEANVSPIIGGWHIRYWESHFRDYEPYARFYEQEGVRVAYRDPLVETFRHIVDHTLSKGLASGGLLNLAVAPGDRFPQVPIDFPKIYAQVLAEKGGLDGELLVCRYPGGISHRGGQVEVDGKTVHAVLEYSDLPSPPAVLRGQRSGQIALFNGPINRVMSDKRNIALLSESLGKGLFDSQQESIIRHHVPWGRVVVPGPTRFQDETHDLVTLLRNYREQLVLKPGDGLGGQGVAVGYFLDPVEWQRKVEEAVSSGGQWIVQERHNPRTMMYQVGSEGFAPHETVWGGIYLGGKHGGTYLRVIPKGTNDGIINASRGAEEAFVYEVV